MTAMVILLTSFTADIIISKSCGLAKSAEMKYYFHVGVKKIVPSVDKTLIITTVIILVILLIIFIIRSL